jgi:hypothetical protein
VAEHVRPSLQIAEAQHLQIHPIIREAGDKTLLIIPELLRFHRLQVDHLTPTGVRKVLQTGAIQTGILVTLREAVTLVLVTEAVDSVPVHMVAVPDHIAVVHPQAVAEEEINSSNP